MTQAGDDISRRPAGLILAGGRGRRLGRGAKAATPLKGRSLIEQVYQRAAPQTRVLAVAPGRQDLDFWRPDIPRVYDGVFAGDGPLAGILAGLIWLETQEGAPWLQVFPCDAPFLPADLSGCLMAAREQTRPVVPRSGGRGQNLFSLWHVSHAAPLARLLEAGQRRAVWGALKDLEAVSLDWPDGAGGFLNVNDMAALETAGRRL